MSDIAYILEQLQCNLNRIDMLIMLSTKGYFWRFRNTLDIQHDTSYICLISNEAKSVPYYT
jgi:hypothetical protein